MPRNTVLAKEVFYVGSIVILRHVNDLKEYGNDSFDYGVVVKVGRKYLTVKLEGETLVQMNLQTRYESGGCPRYYLFPNKAAFKQQLKNERDEHLDNLLRPIEWRGDSSLNFRKNLVAERRQAVRTVYPFLTDYEKERAREWLRKEEHAGLWD